METRVEDKDMALVKVRRAAQITLPAEVREKLGVSEGDYLETEITDRGVLLKPISIVEREKAWDDLMAIIDERKWIGPGPEPSDDELLEMANEEIHAMRREHDQGRS